MIYFLVYLFVEIFVSYEFTKIFTPFGMFLEILASAVFGLMLIRTLNFSLAESMQKVMRREISQEEFISIGMFKFVGAILLVVPGVFTDILGLLMQFDAFGSFVAKKFLTPKETYTHQKDPFESDIIDVEIIEDTKHVK
jgi:UPF0716 family protein affecting phage T7 exclusion